MVRKFRNKIKKQNEQRFCWAHRLVMRFQINKYVDQFNWNKQSISNKSGVVKRSDEAAPSGQKNKICGKIKML
jgi:hypothetical protein